MLSADSSQLFTTASGRPRFRSVSPFFRLSEGVIPFPLQTLCFVYDCCWWYPRRLDCIIHLLFTDRNELWWRGRGSNTRYLLNRVPDTNHCSSSMFQVLLETIPSLYNSVSVGLILRDSICFLSREVYI